jgi:hypothetical protein
MHGLGDDDTLPKIGPDQLGLSGSMSSLSAILICVRGVPVLATLQVIGLVQSTNNPSKLTFIVSCTS